MEFKAGRNRFFFASNPGENNNAAKSAIVKGLYIHGLNLERIAHGYTWEQEEEFISEILLINATAIFDAWVDNFVYSVLTLVSNRKKKDIVSDMKKGEFLSFETELQNEPMSQIKGCFKITGHSTYCDNLRLIYKYFKSCRNCLAHGDKQVRKGRVTIEEVAEDAGMTVEEFKKVMENTPLQAV